MWRGFAHAGCRDWCTDIRTAFCFGDGSLCKLLSILHSQPGRQRRWRTGTAHQFRGSVPFILSNTPSARVLLSAATRSFSATTRSTSCSAGCARLKHIEFLRIGTRVRFSPATHHARALRDSGEHHPLWMSVHVNHPRELTIEVKKRSSDWRTPHTARESKCVARRRERRSRNE